MIVSRLSDDFEHSADQICITQHRLSALLYNEEFRSALAASTAALFAAAFPGAAAFLAATLA